MEEENQSNVILEWLIEKKRYLFFITPCFLFLLILLIRLGGNRERVETDFVTASQVFSKWNGSQGIEGQKLKDLVKVIKKHPELEREYDPAIAQALLTHHKVEGGESFFEKPLKRMGEGSIYYMKFAETSFLMGQGHYHQALQQALKLKEIMVLDTKFWEKANQTISYGSPLFAFNLFRIALLYQQVGNKKGELESLIELKALVKDKTIPNQMKHIDSKGFDMLLTHFSLQETSLVDYITFREEELRK